MRLLAAFLFFLAHLQRAAPFARRQPLRMSSSDDVSALKLKDLRAELQRYGVSTASFLEKSEFVAALVEARAGGPPPEQPSAEEAPAPEPAPEPAAASAAPAAAEESEQLESAMETARGMTVKDLRTALAKRNVGWRDCVEKSELIDRLAPLLVAEMGFSSTGKLRPGTVCELDEDELAEELSAAGKAPMIIDAYAEWCGPCKKLAPELEKLAEELGDRVRIAKLNVDENQDIAIEWSITGLPTVLFMGADGSELHRLQGLRTKDGLLEMAEHLFFGGPEPRLGMQ